MRQFVKLLWTLVFLNTPKFPIFEYLVMQLASFSCARDKQTERINHIRSRGVGLAGMKASQHINV